jgi:catechol 2,3-dioxygenase-like lactoylglutathione lyase family enzyme
MAMLRLNHAVLYVRNAERTAQFYEQVLGFSRHGCADSVPGACFLRAPGSSNDHDIGLFEVGESAGASTAGRGGTVGLWHLAWEVETLAELQRFAEKLEAAGALHRAVDHGSIKSLYGRDPDGMRFEIAWLVPADLLDAADLVARSTLNPLDLPGEIQRYGAGLRGGMGVSRKLPVVD